MQLAMIGLGRMGGNMAKRIAAAGHEVVGYDRSPESDRTVASLEEMVAALTAPRIVWVMVPAGEATAVAVGLGRPPRPRSARLRETAPAHPQHLPPPRRFRTRALPPACGYRIAHAPIARPGADVASSSAARSTPPAA